MTLNSGGGYAKSGATMRGGAILAGTHQSNRATYHEVERAGLGRLVCLGDGVFGRRGGRLSPLGDLWGGGFLAHAESGNNARMILTRAKKCEGAMSMHPTPRVSSMFSH